MIAEKPPSRELMHQVILGYLAGLLQGRGQMGYLEIAQDNGVTLTPFLEFAGDREAVELVGRLAGDVQWQSLSNDRKEKTITITGLRAVMILRLIHPYLRGPKLALGGRIVENGYRISDQARYLKLRDELGAAEEVEQVSEEPVRIVKRVLKL